MRVTAALMVMMPINAFLAFAGHFNLYFGVIVTIAVSIYSVWLLYNGLVEALKTNPETTKIVSYVLIAIIVVFTLVGIGAKKRAARFLDEFNNNKEMMKDLPKN
jgi:hypothetical protein